MIDIIVHLRINGGAQDLHIVDLRNLFPQPRNIATIPFLLIDDLKCSPEIQIKIQFR